MTAPTVQQIIDSLSKAPSYQKVIYMNPGDVTSLTKFYSPQTITDILKNHCNLIAVEVRTSSLVMSGHWVPDTITMTNLVNDLKIV